MVRMMQLLHLPSVPPILLFLQLPLGLGAIRLKDLVQLLAVIFITILLQLSSSFLWPHLLLQVLPLLDTCFNLVISTHFCCYEFVGNIYNYLQMYVKSSCFSIITRYDRMIEGQNLPPPPPLPPDFCQVSDSPNVGVEPIYAYQSEIACSSASSVVISRSVCQI